MDNDPPSVGRPEGFDNGGKYQFGGVLAYQPTKQTTRTERDLWTRFRDAVVNISLVYVYVGLPHRYDRGRMDW